MSGDNMETRVEKFKEYREEIQNSFSESDLTTKIVTSNRVNEIIDEQNKIENCQNDSNTISYDQLMNSYQIYDKGEIDEYVSPLSSKYKKKLAYIITAISVNSLLAIALLVVTILHFGGIL